jgi:hypothetical protein
MPTCPHSGGVPIPVSGDTAWNCSCLSHIAETPCRWRKESLGGSQKHVNRGTDKRTTAGRSRSAPEWQSPAALAKSAQIDDYLAKARAATRKLVPGILVREGFAAHEVWLTRDVVAMQVGAPHPKLKGGAMRTAVLIAFRDKMVRYQDPTLKLVAHDSC